MGTEPLTSSSKRKKNDPHRPICLGELDVLLAIGLPHTKLRDGSEEREFPHESSLRDPLDGPGFVKSPKQAHGNEQAKTAGEKEYQRKV